MFYSILHLARELHVFIIVGHLSNLNKMKYLTRTGRFREITIGVSKEDNEVEKQILFELVVICAQITAFFLDFKNN